MPSTTTALTHLRTLLPLLVLLLPLAAYASSGDRNPTFQHCLKGCGLTYCDPSQPLIPLYLRAFGWSCADNCKYGCMHSFTDNIRMGGKWHQFYGKWPFYRLGPIQEPLSVLFSLGNLYVHLKGMEEVRRRVHRDNQLRGWLLALGAIQVNTWLWSAVFHSRDLPFTERLDYFSATLTIGFSLLYTLLRVFNLITPSGSTRYATPLIGLIALLVISHFTYLLSFPLGQFPYGYHTAFNVCLATAHSFAWIGWSASFYLSLPSVQLASFTLRWPAPYPPLDPLKHRSANAATPALLVGLTTLAMSFELLDFAPLLRMLDAHAMWHLCTIPLGLAWWHFLATDAIELEGASMQSRGVSAAGASIASSSAGTGGSAGGTNEKMPLSGGLSAPSASTSGGGLNGTSGDGSNSVAGSPALPHTPTMPNYAKLAAGLGMGRSASPGRSPGKSPGGKQRED